MKLTRRNPCKRLGATHDTERGQVERDGATRSSKYRPTRHTATRMFTRKSEGYTSKTRLDNRAWLVQKEEKRRCRLGQCAESLTGRSRVLVEKKLCTSLNCGVDSPQQYNALHRKRHLKLPVAPLSAPLVITMFLLRFSSPSPATLFLASPSAPLSHARVSRRPTQNASIESSWRFPLGLTAMKDLLSAKSLNREDRTCDSISLNCKA